MPASTECPYCNLAKKQGELYCSRHDTNMSGLRSGLFLIRTSSFQLCDPHMTRLSLNFNLDGEQVYSVESRNHKISPSRYLLINEGQYFRTSAAYERPARMLTIAYKVGVAKEIYRSLSKTHNQLLDNPESKTHDDLFLFDRGYDMSPELFKKAAALCELNTSDFSADGLESMLDDLLEGILIEHLPVQEEMLSMDKVKLSTKQELFKRLQWTKDYINENYARNLTVEELAGVACLSPFHFKRLFRQLFNQPPYQYIKARRMEKARELLLQGLPVSTVCRSVGWEDSSSFVRLFKQEFEITPKQFSLLTRAGT